MIARRALLLAALALAVPGVAAAKPERTEFYAPLQAINLEFWDREGLFHQVTIDLTVVYAKEGVKVANKVSDLIAKQLSTLPWEEFSRDNPALTIKRVALEVARTDPVGAEVKDVLIARLMLR
ncbi:MAG: hypothetical protein AB1918_03815 [Pseudomonadota bacterium]